MKNNKVVYLHRKKTDNYIFYVGMGNLKRAYSKQRSIWWHRTVNKYGLIIEIFKDNLSLSEACELEIELIKKYGRIDLKTGQLINQTKGGITVEEVSDKCLQKRKKSLKAVVRTKEWNDKISSSLKGIIKSKEWKDKISKTLTGRKLPKEVIEKIKLSNKSKIVTAVPIFCYDYNTSELIKEFYCIRQASIELGCLETSISNNLNNRSQKVNSKTLKKQLKFKYKNK